MIRKPRTELPISVKKHILQDLENSTIQQQELALKYNVDKSVISRIKKDKEKLSQRFLKNENPDRKPPLFGFKIKGSD